MRTISVIAHNIRSTHNIGSILRTADGFGVSSVYLTGYSPYPLSEGDDRLPHLARKIDGQIHKTALGAEITVHWQHREMVTDLIHELTVDDYTVVGLEQSPRSVQLPLFKPPEKLAIIVGREVEGIEPEILDQVSCVIEIPMVGQKESFNVAVATAIVLYHCTYGA